MHTLELVGTEETSPRNLRDGQDTELLVELIRMIQYLCIGDSEPKKITLSDEQITEAVNAADFSFQNDDQTYHVKEFTTLRDICVLKPSRRPQTCFSHYLHLQILATDKRTI